VVAAAVAVVATKAAAARMPTRRSMVSPRRFGTRLLVSRTSGADFSDEVP
jgi:hypothetical protein